MSTPKTAIRVNNIKKSFVLPEADKDTFKNAFLSGFTGKKKNTRQEVLRGISLDIKEGEFFGIVGRNGGGKSTLLKIIAGVYTADEGEVEINGNLTPFIELGVGFNSELTGRENVYMNGALLGMNEKKVDEIYDSIVDFAELRPFMDQKLKNYSSGMKVRLAFSVAIQAHSDILLIDEVLAVGDSSFKKKCYDTFDTFKKEGRTVIFISHSMGMVKKFCDRAALLDKGKIVAEGDPEAVASEYELLNDDRQKTVEETKRRRIKDHTEANIVEKVLATYKFNDLILEVEPGDGKVMDLVSSLGVKTIGLSSEVSEHPDMHSSLSELPDVSAITGLVVFAQNESLSIERLQEVIAELDDGKLSQVHAVYVNLPFDVYRDYMGGKGKSISLTAVSKLLEEKGYYPTVRGIHGSPGVQAQHNDAVFQRFNQEAQERLWGEHLRASQD